MDTLTKRLPIMAKQQEHPIGITAGLYFFRAFHANIAI
jgi:hypothetical protein